MIDRKGVGQEVPICLVVGEYAYVAVFEHMNGARCGA